jgi:hypothetical protein
VHPYPGQPQPAAGPTLTLHTSYPWLAFMLALFSPVATINGHTVPLQWGDNHIPLQPGVHDVRVHVKYLWEVGRAQLQVDNRAGGPVNVWYAAPPIAFMGGAIDYQPVKPPNQGLAIALFVGIPGALILLSILCCCLGSLTES